jgi:ABC-2 type transport system permease protein
MKQLRKLFEANFKSTFREKQVWFWSIFYPVLLLVIFLMIFGRSSDDGSSFKAKIAVVADRQTEFASQVISGLKQVPVLEWKDENPVSRDKAEEWIKSKDIDAAIVVPSDPSSAKEIALLLNKEKENSALQQAMSGILGSFITQMNFGLAKVTPQLSLKTEFVTIGGNPLKYVDFLLTGLIALSISQAGLFGMVAMVEMRRNGLLKRLMLAPVNMNMYGLSSMLVRFILGLVQVVLLTLIGVLFFHAKLHVDIFSFLLVFVVGTISFTAMGFMIAALSKSMESYFGLANLTSFLMMFISGIFFDATMLPDYIKPISRVLPLTYFANGIRDGMVYGFGVTHPQLWIDLGILALWGAAAFLIGSRFHRWKGETR